ncbi:MAG TPA: NosD domain-containing protein [Longimicrobiales bacterium]|nr:NosD domain-containing protein [Longimicrobiales bacterium]
MKKTVAALLVTLLVPVLLHAQETVLFTPGMVITSSVRVAPGVYRLPGPGLPEQALISIRGDGIEVDLSGVRLEGLPREADPDGARGVAIRVDGGRDVTLRGGEIRGYRFGVVARGTRNLRILDMVLSYNWKPRLFSQRHQESLVDWLSFHDNENREWMRFGAALYLEDVTGGEIRRTRAVQGMNGLLMTRTDSILVAENDFSFNSGLGAGLYRSSWNVILGNRFDYDVRGYSEGIYQRGQDSAGLLLYEQSSHNVVAYNSATHSGDGFFLWAGQSTMETGEGGANHNLLFANDFSHAPTNSVEVTFSQNRILGNLLRGSRYGVWGGYSWGTEIRGNCFGGNRFGVAIEHGQHNIIVRNRFDGDSVAVRLWARETQPGDWGYPRHRDTRSRDYFIAGNTFAGNALVREVEATSGEDFTGNQVLASIPEEACDPRALLGREHGTLSAEVRERAAALVLDTLDSPGGLPSAIPTTSRADLPRSAIVVDEWGPWDGRSPLLWPLDTLASPVRLQVRGPEGAWRVAESRGVAELSVRAGAVGDTLVVEPRDAGDWQVTLEYRGEATVSPRGTVRGPGEGVRFGFGAFNPVEPWTVRFFAWEDSAADPHRNPRAFDALFRGEPLLTRTETRFDYQWYTPRIPALPQERWAAEATTSVELEPGTWSLRTISDDGIRVWVDGTLVVDRFDPHGSEVDYASLAPGRHEIRVRYFQLEGWSEARVEVVRGDARSTGSAGPH